MGKKVKTQKKEAKAAVEAPAAEPELAPSDSVQVAMKKANDANIKKQLKVMKAAVAEKVDLKQLVKAAKALKAFAKKQSEQVAEHALLTDED